MHRSSRSNTTRIALVCLLSTAVLLSACSAAVETDVAPANRATQDASDLSWWSKPALDAFLNLSAMIGFHSGYVAMFARDGRVVHASTAGYADIEARRPMQLDTRFRMASMTKPVTASAALLLIEEGRLGLDDPVERYIPAAGALRVAASRELGEDGTLPTVALARPLTVRHLLTFTAGIGSEEDSSDLGRLWGERDIYAGTGSLEQRVDRILTAPLYEQPGETWRYGWSADVLARVVEVAANEPFDHFLERRIFQPLGMVSTSFLPPEGQRDRMAKMYTQDEDGELIPVDSPASDAVDWTPGGSGLVSTAGDYMRFALMLWNGGSYAGVQILSRESVELMTTPHVASGVLATEGYDGLGWGLGLSVVVDADATPMIDRTGDFWWSGYYGTTFFVSPESGLVGLVLTQNQPGPFSDLPYTVFLAQAFAFLGL
jgi:CubicO group peptidase (beta-lactamase class C family)